MCRKGVHKNTKKENTMAVITNNYVYSISMKKSAQKKIPIMKKSTIEECRKISAKYSKEIKVINY